MLDCSLRYIAQVACIGWISLSVCVSRTQHLFKIKFSYPELVLQNRAALCCGSCHRCLWGSLKVRAFQAAWEVQGTCSKNKIMVVVIIIIVSSETILCMNKINFLYFQNNIFLPSLPLKTIIFHLHLLHGYIKDQSLNLRTNRRSVVKGVIVPRGMKLDEPNIICHYYFKKTWILCIN